ncbi:autotransporter domain-containing protein [Altericroceibacterium xinjiangense]|uniref:autotransporter domain-containing protein n=1 Tax=Altericroceibacterium xinjiangense TaxID=762261 RepID=UPI000F7F4B4D|nr:autotransporter outer membrane beta-barrel domain-containing protein [Altericroceibacterium xinjiangense]
MRNFKARLVIGVAGAAMAAGYTAPAHAACNVTDETVTCTDTSTVTTVNGAIAAVPGDDVALIVTETANVVQPTGYAGYVSTTKPGAVSIDNAGTFGTEAMPVGISYHVPWWWDGLETNTFSLVNSGDITGHVSLSRIGGAVSVTSTGSIGSESLSGTAIYVGNSQFDAPIEINLAGTVNTAGQGTGIYVTTRGDVGINVAGNIGNVATDTAASSLDDILVDSLVAIGRTPSTTTTTDGTATTTTTLHDWGSTMAVGGAVLVELAEGANTGGITASGLEGSTVLVNGTVGAEDDYSYISASSAIEAVDYTTVAVTDANRSSIAYTSVRTTEGGTAEVSVGTTGQVIGGITATGHEGALAANAGTVMGAVYAQTADWDQTFAYGSGTGPDGNSNYYRSTSERTGGDAIVINAAGGLIGSTPANPVLVRASGGSSAMVENAGRINGDIAVDAGLNSTTYDNSGETRTVTDPVTLAQTTTTDSVYETARQSLGGAATFRGAEGSLVVGHVSVLGEGDVIVINDGAVTGMTSAESSAADRSSTETRNYVTVFTPGADGGTISESASQYVSTLISSGGDVTGTYAGTNGALQFVPGWSGTSGSDGSVVQSADGTSTALVTGAVFGTFTGTASGREYTEDYTQFSRTEYGAAGTVQGAGSGYTYTDGERYIGGDSVLAVDGGLISGYAAVSADGNAAASLGNGAMIGGDLSVSSGDYSGYDVAQSSSTTANYVDDVTSTSNALSYQELAGTGDVSVIIDDAAVAGNVTLDGSSGTASFVLGDAGEVGGAVFVLNDLTLETSETSDGTENTPEGSITNSTQTIMMAAAGGDVSANVAGVIGNNLNGAMAYGEVGSAPGTNLSLISSAGDASATVTGQVMEGIVVRASGEDTALIVDTVADNTGLRTVATQFSNTAVGGTASLVVDATNPTVPANFGNIYVAGMSGSTVTIGEGSSVLAAMDGAVLQVGDLFYDLAVRSQDASQNGALFGDSSSSYSSTAVGGPSALMNDGWVGYDGGADYSGDAASVVVTSTTNASLTNNGWIFGDVAVRSLWSDFANTRTTTDAGDVTRVDTFDRILTAMGGSAELTNNGLITGDAALAAANGVLVNNGVLRGDVNLGANVDNYATQRVATSTDMGEETVTAAYDPFVQAYSVAQNGLLGGRVNVGGAWGIVDDTVQTSDVTATVNLNAGSVTGGGVWADFDEETGDRYTSTAVNLNGGGWLGLGDAALAQLGDAFGDMDPQIGFHGSLEDLGAYQGGARVVGVDTLNKTGAGAFLITGADYMPVTNANPIADYTLDVGSFTINGGEVQLTTASADGVFGIRGDVVNNAALVLGNRVQLPAPLFGTNASASVIDGTEVYQNGDFTQSGTGTLTVGIMPTLVRVGNGASTGTASVSPLAVPQTLLSSGLFTTPENAFGPAFADLGSSFLTVDGDLNLGGTVQLVSPTGGLFTDGQSLTIASVSGTVTEAATVAVNNGSNFVTFDLGTRSEGGRTVLYVTADRQGYETAALNENAAAAGAALSAAFPGVIQTINNGAPGGIGTNGTPFAMAQDLAGLFVGLDTLATRDQAATILDELSSGSFYGSLTTLKTTAPFVDALSNRRAPAGATGLNLWFTGSGDWIRLDGDEEIGSTRLKADNYGGSLGLGVSTGSGEIGVGVGYGRIDSHTAGRAIEADAHTWMVGVYAREELGPLAIGANLVYGWSDWDATRVMPTLSRTAQAEFDSNELRGDIRAEYMIPLNGAYVAPFGQVEVRRFDFDGFSETGAGAIGLMVGDTSTTVITPSVGLKVGSNWNLAGASVRPEASVSYSFQGDNDSWVDVAYLGAPANAFRLQGVDPEDYVTFAAGLFEDIGRNSSAYVRGSYATGGGVEIAGLKAGVVLSFGQSAPVTVIAAPAPIPAPVATGPETKICPNGAVMLATADCPLPPPPPAPPAPPLPTPRGERG